MFSEFLAQSITIINVIEYIYRYVFIYFRFHWNKFMQNWSNVMIQKSEVHYLVEVSKKWGDLAKILVCIQNWLNILHMKGVEYYQK